MVVILAGCSGEPVNPRLLADSASFGNKRGIQIADSTHEWNEAQELLR